MSEIWGIPTPKNWGPKPPFWTTSQLNDNLNSLYLPSKTRCT